MRAPAFAFERPDDLQADAPAELFGRARDEVRLLVTRPGGSTAGSFVDLADYLDPGDLLVVNASATMAASLPARGPFGPFRLHLSTRYGPGDWLTEPRWSEERPGPLPLATGASFKVAGISARVTSRYPGIPRLLFVRLEGDVDAAMRAHGAPIRYAYARPGLPISAYQTIFAEVPGSAEMPSAGRPFSARVVERLHRKGIVIAPILLHTGVSSLEVGDVAGAAVPVFPEPFEVPMRTAAAIDAARRRGSRIIAVGTTVVRAIESAYDGHGVRPARGFTQAYISPRRGVQLVDGLLTGFHDPRTTHLAMLCAIAGVETVREAYAVAVERRFRWHEFGDSHLLLAGARPVRAGRSRPPVSG